MTADTQTNGSGQRKFEIRLEGRLDERRQRWFEDVNVEIQNDITILTGLTEDRAALHGLLKRIHDLNLTLQTVNLKNPKEKAE